MSIYSFVLVAILADVCLCQMHGDQSLVECFNCDGHGAHFPSCLQNSHACHADQVCRVRYGGDNPNFHCQDKQDCQKEIDHAHNSCEFGGMEVHHQCQKCCDSTDCVTAISANLTAKLTADGGVMCPTGCTDDNIQACNDHAIWCRADQFCQITRDDKHNVMGECLNDHELKHCNDELKHKKCDTEIGHVGDLHMHGHDHSCYDACCDDQACVSGVIAGADELNTLWTRLNGDCSDQLAADQCQQLKGGADICHDRLAMSVCPMTCGLCGALESHVCEDTVLNNGCADLKVTENVCASDVAVFICPKTCNMCDELLNSLIISLIDGTSNATALPASMLPPSANPSDYPTFDCDELDTSDCGVMDSLCKTSFVGVVCPEHCKMCMSPIMTNPVTNMPTDAATMPASTAMDTTQMPSSVAMDTSPPTMAASDSTMGAPEVSTAALPVCSDHLNGMDCSALPNVCGSVMALSVCPKYCGLC
ncbi:hypothetical protein EGW08_010559 [Elysia chlorotica]|uniref:ShKT domain-containing protein n=1 Tax=Elysia chlorotica TaxID=188477 RepID=A0A3S1B7L1_ELYCH|nr:hypothetical protein EGW08_010559 [Elysia chlorotica]